MLSPQDFVITLAAAPKKRSLPVAGVGGFDGKTGGGMATVEWGIIGEFDSIDSRPGEWTRGLGDVLLIARLICLRIARNGRCIDETNVFPVDTATA